jgi:ATP-binding cassette subfamily B multidrug efflux pump
MSDERGPPTSEQSDLAITGRLFKELTPDMRSFVVALLLYGPILAAQLGQPFVIGFAVDEGMRVKDLGAVGWWAGVYILTVFAQTLTESGQLFLMQRMGLRAVRRLRERLFAKIQRLPTSYFDHMPLGKVMTRVTNDVESLSELFSSGAVRIVGDLLFLLGTLLLLFSVDYKLALAGVSTLPVLAIGVQLFRQRARQAFRRVRALLSELNAYLQEHLSGMHVVQLFDQIPRVRERFEDSNRGYMLANREAIALDAGVYAFVDAMSTVAVAVVLLVGAGLQEAGALTLGILVAFVEALGRFFVPIRELSNKYTVIQSALASAERIYELEDQPITITSDDDAPAAVFEHDLVFDDVHFRYAEGPEIIRGVSIRVSKGERVAICGHTGSGKSTLAKLATRTYDVSDGRILLDDRDLRELDLHSLRQTFTAVPQDVFLFRGTIRDNLNFGRDEPIGDDALIAAARACQADSVLDRHGGLDAEVVERGQNLSLGERQLLALARALVTDPPILILDEATASVDRETERRLEAATDTLIEGRTAIIIAHRLSTIRRCDRILLLHAGKVDEEGTHEELMAAGGRYAKLVALQQQEGG